MGQADEASARYKRCRSMANGVCVRAEGEGWEKKKDNYEFG
jgi:hypothetical protein